MQLGPAPVSTTGARALFELVLAVICAGSTVSCTHQVQTSTMAAATPPPMTAVRSVMVRQAQNAKDAGDGDLELRRLRQFLAANPKSEDARVLLARYYEARGLPDVALEHYRLASAQFPNSQVIAISLAKTLRAMGDLAEAARTLAEFAARQPHPEWQVLSLEAVVEDEQGRHAEAEKAHRDAVAAAPDRSDLHNNLGYCLLDQGRAEAAAEEFRRAVELDPQSEIAHNNLAAALARSGSKANDTTAAAVAEWSRSESPAEAHNNMAAVLIEQGRYDEARAQLGAALAADPTLGAAFANLRLVAEKDGGAAGVPMRGAQAAHRKPSRLAKILGWFGESKSGKPGSKGDTPSVNAPGNSAPAEASSKKGGQ